MTSSPRSFACLIYADRYGRSLFSADSDRTEPRLTSKVLLIPKWPQWVHLTSVASLWAKARSSASRPQIGHLLALSGIKGSPMHYLKVPHKELCISIHE